MAFCFCFDIFSNNYRLSAILCMLEFEDALENRRNQCHESTLPKQASLPTRSDSLPLENEQQLYYVCMFILSYSTYTYNKNEP